MTDARTAALAVLDEMQKWWKGFERADPPMAKRVFAWESALRALLVESPPAQPTPDNAQVSDGLASRQTAASLPVGGKTGASPSPEPALRPQWRIDHANLPAPIRDASDRIRGWLVTETGRYTASTIDLQIMLDRELTRAVQESAVSPTPQPKPHQSLDIDEWAGLPKAVPPTPGAAVNESGFVGLTELRTKINEAIRQSEITLHRDTEYGYGRRGISAVTNTEWRERVEWLLDSLRRARNAFEAELVRAALRAQQEPAKYRSEEWQILDAMTQFGGGFVKALATTYRLADFDNQCRLELAFRKYFLKYDEMAVASADSKVKA